MNIKAMKNIIVLKDLPSNIAEEAIVILKSNSKIKNKEIIENKSMRRRSRKFKWKLWNCCKRSGIYSYRILKKIRNAKRKCTKHKKDAYAI